MKPLLPRPGLWGGMARRASFWISGMGLRTRTVVRGKLEGRFSIRSYGEYRAVETFLSEEKSEGRVLDWLLESLGDGDVAYDIGANVGLHTVFLAKRVGARGTVVSIEPEKANFRRLRTNLGLNNLANVLPVEAALGEEEKTAELFGRKRIGIGAFTLRESPDGRPSQTVKIYPGDELARAEEWPLPNVVKIDVEGYEYAVLRGLRNLLAGDACRTVCCEVHPRLLPQGVSTETIIGFLESLGFSPARRVARGTEIHLLFAKGEKALTERHSRAYPEAGP